MIDDDNLTDYRECSRCGDDVLTLSSDDLCDGCVAEDASIQTTRSGWTFHPDQEVGFSIRCAECDEELPLDDHLVLNDRRGYAYHPGCRPTVSTCPACSRGEIVWKADAHAWSCTDPDCGFSDRGDPAYALT